MFSSNYYFDFMYVFVFGQSSLLNNVILFSALNLFPPLASFSVLAGSACPTPLKWLGVCRRRRRRPCCQLPLSVAHPANCQLCRVASGIYS